MQRILEKEVTGSGNQDVNKARYPDNSIAKALCSVFSTLYPTQSKKNLRKSGLIGEELRLFSRCQRRKCCRSRGGVSPASLLSHTKGSTSTGCRSTGLVSALGRERTGVMQIAREAGQELGRQGPPVLGELPY